MKVDLAIVVIEIVAVEVVEAAQAVAQKETTRKRLPLSSVRV